MMYTHPCSFKAIDWIVYSFQRQVSSKHVALVHIINSTCHCWWTSVLELWKGDYVNIHMCLLFTLSIMYSRLVQTHAILACSKYERFLDHLLKMLLLTPNILELWNGDFINAHAPSPITLSKCMIDYCPA